MVPVTSWAGWGPDWQFVKASGRAGLKNVSLGLPGGAGGKEPTCQRRRRKRCGFNPWVKKIPWKSAWQLTPVFLPGESNGQRSLAGTVHGVTKSQTQQKWLGTCARNAETLRTETHWWRRRRAPPVCSQPNMTRAGAKPNPAGPALSGRVSVRPGHGVLTARTQCQQLTSVVALFSFFFFWYEPFFKVFIQFVTVLSLFFKVSVSRPPEACRITAPRAGIEPTPRALEAKVLIAEPPGKALLRISNHKVKGLIIKDTHLCNLKGEWWSTQVSEVGSLGGRAPAGAPPAHPDALGQAPGPPGQGHGPSQGPRSVSHQRHGPAPPFVGGGRRVGLGPPGGLPRDVSLALFRSGKRGPKTTQSTIWHNSSSVLNQITKKKRLSQLCGPSPHQEPSDPHSLICQAETRWSLPGWL